jgi:hypothetical protein
MNVPELRQGPTDLCWAFCVAESFDAKGKYVSAYDIYSQVKGVAYSGGVGLPATFTEVQEAINVAAKMTNCHVKFLNGNGVINDDATFDQAVRDGTWFIIAGINAAVLWPGQNYGHFVVVESLYFTNGTPFVKIADSYRNYDGGSDEYTLNAFHNAMHANWDPNVDAIAFQVVPD